MRFTIATIFAALATFITAADDPVNQQKMPTQNNVKVFHQPNAKGKWQYIYPFADQNYVLAIQYDINPEGSSPMAKNTVIYYGKKTSAKDQLIWKEHLLMHVVKDNFRYDDYNNDGVKDLLLFTTTGSRGSNEHYNLYLINPKTKMLNKVSGFDEITNPTYHQKHKIILGYGYAGINSYTVYRIKNNKIVQVGQSFEDTDTLDLDQKIAKILKTN